MSVSPSRRRLLQAAAFAPVAAGCTSHGRIDDTHTSPDVRIRQAAVARERALVEQYRAAAASSAGQVATRTAGLLEQHEQHLAALGSAAGASPSETPMPTPTQLPVPTLPQLVAAEHAAAAAHSADALQASSSLAALLASLAASEASHAVVLT